MKVEYPISLKLGTAESPVRSDLSFPLTVILEGVLNLDIGSIISNIQAERLFLPIYKVFCENPIEILLVTPTPTTFARYMLALYSRLIDGTQFSSLTIRYQSAEIFQELSTLSQSDLMLAAGGDAGTNQPSLGDLQKRFPELTVDYFLDVQLKLQQARREVQNEINAIRIEHRGGRPSGGFIQQTE